MNEAILVIIPEKPCKTTLISLWETAKNPESIFVGFAADFENLQKIKVFPMSHPLHTISQKNQMYVEKPIVFQTSPDFHFFVGTLLLSQRRTRYVLHITSHTLFTLHWDFLLCQTYQNFKKLVVLSFFPKDLSNYHSKDQKVPFLNKVSYMKNGYVCIKKPDYFIEISFPKRSYLISKLFFFTESRLWEVIKPNPYLKWNLCENILFSARLFTHNIEIYTPHWNVIFCQYNHKKTPLVFGDQEIIAMLQNKYFQKEFGFGKYRTLPEFFQILGIQHRYYEKNCDSNLFYVLWITMLIILMIDLIFLWKNHIAYF